MLEEIDKKNKNIIETEIKLNDSSSTNTPIRAVPFFSEHCNLN